MGLRSVAPDGGLGGGVVKNLEQRSVAPGGGGV